MIAALYVDKNGIYYGLDDVDPWDEARDARLYAGPWPVVAHPPCNHWVSYGPFERRGADGGCFAAALDAVREYGGVLEHPALSRAWEAFGLPRPQRDGWTAMIDDPGWACEVDQHLYGFPTRKVTWLYYVGENPIGVDLSRSSATRGCETLWSTERSKTPPAFRDVLLDLARDAGRVKA